MVPWMFCWRMTPVQRLCIHAIQLSHYAFLALCEIYSREMAMAGRRAEQNCSGMAGVEGQGEDESSECEAYIGRPQLCRGRRRSHRNIMQMQVQLYRCNFIIFFHLCFLKAAMSRVHAHPERCCFWGPPEVFHLFTHLLTVEREILSPLDCNDVAIWEILFSSSDKDVIRSSC